MKKDKYQYFGPLVFGEEARLELQEDSYFFLDEPRARKRSVNVNEINDFNKDNPTLKPNELNSSFFRSEEFIHTHEGLHVLFAGCSYTFGYGVDLDKTWSKIVYDSIKQNNKTSGYFNIGSSGASIMESISLIFKYCKTYGNPEVVFLNMPNFDRFYSLDSFSKIRLSFLKQKNSKVLNLLAYQYYLMLDLYCKNNDIDLYSFTWSLSDNPDYTGVIGSKINTFSTYHEYDLLESDTFVEEYLKNNIGSKRLANDDNHLGEPYHQYWANFIYERYVNDNSRS